MGFAANYLLGKKNIVKESTLKVVNDTFVSIKDVLTQNCQIQGTSLLNKYLQAKVISIRQQTRCGN